MQPGSERWQQRVGQRASARSEGSAAKHRCRNAARVSTQAPWVRVQSECRQGFGQSLQQHAVAALSEPRHRPKQTAKAAGETSWPHLPAGPPTAWKDPWGSPPAACGSAAHAAPAAPWPGQTAGWRCRRGEERRGEVGAALGAAQAAVLCANSLFDGAGCRGRATEQGRTCAAGRLAGEPTCVMAARCMEPSGFFTILMGLISTAGGSREDEQRADVVRQLRQRNLRLASAESIPAGAHLHCKKPAGGVPGLVRWRH